MSIDKYMDDETKKFSREEGKPLYEQVRIWLLEQVTSDRWPIHHMLPPEVTLAAELGISRVTLRQAMSDLVQHGVFTRISGRGTFVAARTETGVVPRKISRLKQTDGSETQLIGVVAPYTHVQFASTVIAHIEHALYERGYRMLLTNSQASLDLQSEHLRQMVDFGVAGIVLYSGAFLHDETVNFVQRRKVPIVLLDRYYPAIETSVVTSNHWQGAYMMTEHLLQQGHRRIGFILARPEVVTSTLARFEGYKAALRDYGLEFEEDLVMNAQVREASVQTYLQRSKPTAIFARNDDCAIDILHVSQTLGLRVPDDFALVGFDDLPIVSRLHPPLTTVMQHMHQLGETTVQLLVEMIETGDMHPRKIVLPTELVIRQSSTRNATTSPTFEIPTPERKNANA